VGFGAEPFEGGTVVGVPLGKATPCTSSLCTVMPGRTVGFEATARPGFRFDGWSGCSASTTSPLWLVNLGSTPPRCVARFTEANPKGTVRLSASSGGTVSANGAAAGACTASSCTVGLGTSLTLTAVPSAGYQFDGWAGCGSAASGRVLALTSITGTESCQAVFSQVRFIVQVTAGPGGRATASATSVPSGGSAALQAIPDAGYRFVGYAGGPACNGSTTTLVLSPILSNVACTATFLRTQQIGLAGTFSDVRLSATSTSGVTTCSSAALCTSDAGSVVTVVANAAAGLMGDRLTCSERGTGRTLVSGFGADGSARLVLQDMQADWDCFGAAVRVLY
jgi:hypothetical protein